MLVLLFVFVYSVVKRGRQELPERLESAHCRSRGLGEVIKVAYIICREAVLGEPELIFKPVGCGMIRIIAAGRAF